jgi:signal transduction histidine kinase
MVGRTVSYVPLAVNAGDLGIGCLELALAGVMLRPHRRFRRDVPWLVAPIAFFAFRGLDRAAGGFIDHEPLILRSLVDALVAGILALMLFVIDTLFSGIELMRIAARAREREYERALADYRRVARHRLANPLAAIEGSARALRDLPELDEGTGARLLNVILVEANRLERVALEPDAELGPEEHDLRPQP